MKAPSSQDAHRSDYNTDHMNTICNILSETTNNSSMENSGIVIIHDKSRTRDQKHYTSPNNKEREEQDEDKNLRVEPIYERNDEEDPDSEGYSNSMRDIPTFGKGSMNTRSPSASKRLKRSASMSKDNMSKPSKDLVVVSPLTQSTPLLLVNIVNLNMEESTILITMEEDPSLSIMRYCCEHGINDMSLVMIIKKMITREIDRKCGGVQNRHLQNLDNRKVHRSYIESMSPSKPLNQPTKHSTPHINKIVLPSSVNQSLYSKRESNCNIKTRTRPEGGNMDISSYNNSNINIYNASPNRSRTPTNMTNKRDALDRTLKILNNKENASATRRKSILSPTLTSKMSLTANLISKLSRSKKSISYVGPGNTNSGNQRSSIRQNNTINILQSSPSLSSISMKHMKKNRDGCEEGTLHARRNNNKDVDSNVRYIFDMLDGDKDGYISSDRISILNVPNDLLRVLHPFIHEIKYNHHSHQIDVYSFADMILRLHIPV